MKRAVIPAILLALAAAGLYGRCGGSSDDSSGDKSATSEESRRSDNSWKREPGNRLFVALRADPLDVVVRGEVELYADVVQGEARPGRVRYRWHAVSGTIEEEAAARTVWTASGKPGRHQIAITVEDDLGETTEKVMINVRLPSPRDDADLAALMKAEAERAEQAMLAEYAAMEAKLAELRELGEKRDSVEDRLRALTAYEELGDLLIQLGRYEEASEVFSLLRGAVLPSDKNYKKYSERYGMVAFYLGDEDAALEAFQAGGNYTQGMSSYMMAEILERRGETAEALAAYALAADGEKWFPDPVYRQALLELEAGAEAAEIAALLVDASTRLDRDRMIQRLGSDAELAPLWRALEETGRVGDLRPMEPLVLDGGEIGPGNE